MTTLSSRSSITSIAERSACTIVIGERVAVAGAAPTPAFVSAAMLDLRLLALPAQVLWHLLEHVLERRRHARNVTVEQRAVALGVLLRRAHLGLERGLRLAVLVLRPGADGDEVLL